MGKNMFEAMRWGQLTLTEGDLESLDPDYWLDYFDKSRCDGVVLSTGGYMAFHPTRIPFHYRALSPDKEDIFGYMAEGVRRRGSALICRTDGHAFHDDARAAHPEWVFINADGTPRRHWAYSQVWVSCPLGDYGFDFMNDVHREIGQNYDIHGIFCNRWAGSGICYCPSCQKSFKEKSGYAIPQDTSRTNPVFQAYLAWREEKLFELCRTWDETLKEARPGTRFIPNSTVGPMAQLNSNKLGEYSDILFCDRQARHGNMPPWFNGRNAREMRAVMGKKPMGGIFSVGIEETPRWKDSVQEPAELALWVSDAVANGLRPWFTKFSGLVFDDRWMDTVAELYKKYENWEPFLGDYESLAETALVFSGETVRKYGGDRTEELTEAPLNGFYQALTEARIPFDMFDADRLSRENLAPYRRVILPNTAVLSREQCRILTEFVEQGGGLVATFETSLYDEEGNRRDDFGLGDLFGAQSRSAKPIEGIKNSYIRCDAAPGLGREGRSMYRSVGSVNRADITLLDIREPAPYHAVPPYPDLPMEEVYPRGRSGKDKADYEEVIRVKRGQGRSAYLPGDLDRCYWEFLVPDLKRILTENMGWVTGGEYGEPVRLTGPGFIDFTVFENGEGLIIHMVNMTTVNAMRGPAQEIIPLENLKLAVRKDLRKNWDGKACLLESDMSPERAWAGEYEIFTIPRLHMHEVLVISKTRRTREC